ncbi:MAG TPA: chorismate synthase [Clostridia bacterium]|nr:chorismate synthase [Clostridia bacterium]
MGSIWGNRLKISVFGESHGAGIGVIIDGLPAGIRPDEQAIGNVLARRKPKRSAYSTTRTEDDIPKVISGLYQGRTNGAPLCAVFENTNVRSDDYSELAGKPRPGHSDFTAYIKYRGFNDPRGGGHFSGRLTACLVYAGAICMQVLGEKGIEIGSHIYSIGSIQDLPFDLDTTPELLKSIKEKDFPVIDDDAGAKMITEIEHAAREGDSIGGVIECCALGMPAGIGNPMFWGAESVISSIVFSIPAIKGVEFGRGFELSRMRGSAANDAFTFQGGKVVTKSNNCGGILGGITNGMPVVFRACIKPTASIFNKQDTVDLAANTDTVIKVKGRHDSCIAPRAAVAVESAAAIALLDMMLSNE